MDIYLLLVIGGIFWVIDKDMIVCLKDLFVFLE